jgi:uncharacterized protein
MKIAVISDTHLRKHTEKMSGLISKHFADVDMVIHAGDFTNARVISLIKANKKLIGVWGNNDGEEIRSILKEKEIVVLNGYRIGIYHGHGEEKTTQDRAIDLFKSDRVDIIIFGHSHKPLIMTKKDVLIINPGSITSKRNDRWYSYVILELQKDSIKAELKFFS